MQFTAEHLTRSVIAVPPLARDARRNICGPENAKIIQHLQTNGIRSLLYGGNALLYQIGMHEYTGLLSLLNNTASSDTMVVPSIGPTYGMAMEQLAAFDDFDFPTVMLLPSRDAVNQRGVANAIADFANRFGGPIVVYIKHDRWLDAALIRSLEAAGAISWIKYAVVRDQPQDDDYLREILDIFPADRMVSGIGEQPAIVHVRDFGLAGFTSGCVCVAPRQSMQLLQAIQTKDFAAAESIRHWFRPLEDLRNEINPMRVLHEAVELAGIAHTGDWTPMLSELSPAQRERLKLAVEQLSAVEPLG